MPKRLARLALTIVAVAACLAPVLTPRQAEALPAAVRTAAAVRAPAAAAGKSYAFNKLPAAKYLSCSKSAKITGTFGVDVSGVSSSFRKWTKADRGSKFSASLTWKTTISAALNVSAEKTSMECRPGKSLKKDFSARFVIDGVVIKLSPDFLLKISAEGDVTASDTITDSVTVSGKLGLHTPVITPHFTRDKPSVSAKGMVTFDAVVGADAAISAGIVGLDLELLGGLHATASAQSSPVGVCVAGYPELWVIGTVTVGILKWKAEWQFVNQSYAIKSVAGHSLKFDLCTYSPPKVIPGVAWSASLGQQPELAEPGGAGGVVVSDCDAQAFSATGVPSPVYASSAGNCYWGAVTDADGNVYGNSNAAVDAYKANGAPLWSADSGYSIWRDSNVRLGWNGSVFVTNFDGRNTATLLGFDAATGAKTFSESLPDIDSFQPYAGGIAVAEPTGAVYYGYDGHQIANISDDADLGAYEAYSAASGAAGTLFIAGFGTTCGGTLNIVKMTPAGKAWSLPIAGVPCTQTGLTATSTGGVIVSYQAASGAVTDTYVTAGGTKSWTYQLAAPSGATMATYVSSGVAGSAGEVAIPFAYGIDGGENSSGGRRWSVVVLSVQDGKVLTTVTDTEPAEIGPVAIANGDVVVTETLTGTSTETYDVRGIPVAGLGNDYRLSLAF